MAALQRDIDASRTAEPPPDTEAVTTEAEAVSVAPLAAESEPVAEPEPVAELPPEPDAGVEPDVIEDVAAEAATDAETRLAEAVEPVAEIDAGAGEETVEAAIEEAQAADEVSAEAETSEQPQASVPSYYSTDVVEPDWFADGDFSWLEAAQAEAIRLEAEQAQSAERFLGVGDRRR